MSDKTTKKYEIGLPTLLGPMNSVPRREHMQIGAEGYTVHDGMLSLLVEGEEDGETWEDEVATFPSGHWTYVRVVY